MFRKRRGWWVAAVGVVVLAPLGAWLVTSAGGSEATLADPARSGMTLAEARAFPDFALYYVGEEFDGHRIAAIHRRGVGAPSSELDAQEFVSIKYGSCAPTSDSGCPLPLEIQVARLCERNPSVYQATRPAPDGTPAVPYPFDATRVQGVPAAFYGDTTLEVYTADVTIALFGTSRAQLLAAGAALRRLNPPSAVVGKLPKPPAGILESAVACT